MGVEIPIEEVPVLQKEIIKKANACGKHVITATQMLESMIQNPRPTRAEATDIANAIYDGTTAIMLSGETASGKYPVEALKTMSRIAEYAEQNIDYRARMKKVACDAPDITAAISHASCDAAMDLKAAAIVTVSMSGYTAEALAKFKPGCPIIVCTTSEQVCRQCNLLWGVMSIQIPMKETSEDLFKEAIAQVKKTGYAKKGDIIVITAGMPLGIAGRTNMIRVVEVE
jgi:pyruvate kinase